MKHSFKTTVLAIVACLLVSVNAYSMKTKKPATHRRTQSAPSILQTTLQKRETRQTDIDIKEFFRDISPIRGVNTYTLEGGGLNDTLDLETENRTETPEEFAADFRATLAAFDDTDEETETETEEEKEEEEEGEDFDERD